MKILNFIKSKKINTRLLVKSFIWEFNMFVLIALFMWFWFGDLIDSIKFNIIVTVFKSFGLYFYQLAWKKSSILKDKLYK